MQAFTRVAVSGGYAEQANVVCTQAWGADRCNEIGQRSLSVWTLLAQKMKVGLATIEHTWSSNLLHYAISNKTILDLITT